MAVAAFLDSFATTLALLDPLAKVVESDAGDDVKAHLKRARVLHGVLTAKAADANDAALPAEQLKRMASEWTRGMLDATFPVETAISDRDFAAADQPRLNAILAALDGTHECTGRLAGLIALAASAASSSSSSSPATCPEADVLGVELWEALCWRRGSLRYYVAKTNIEAVTTAGRAAAAALDGGAAGESAATAVANHQAGRAAAPSVGLLEEAHAALTLVLSARQRSDDDADDANEALRYGVSASPHLLALVFLGELCYWRWAATPSADADTAALWFGRAAVCCHRYIHCVAVLMEGCGWSIDQPVALLRLLADGRRGALASALAGERAVSQVTAIVEAHT